MEFAINTIIIVAVIIIIIITKTRNKDDSRDIRSWRFIVCVHTGNGKGQWKLLQYFEL